MAQDTDHDRISRKAHELWESEGRPHGRDQVHWDEAKEIVALEDSLDETLLPRDTGAGEPEEPPLAVTNQGEMPNLTDQGANDLTSTDREPEKHQAGRRETGSSLAGRQRRARRGHREGLAQALRPARVGHEGQGRRKGLTHDRRGLELELLRWPGRGRRRRSIGAARRCR